ncbi:MAG TPA: MXAN_5187 C-terminal domain-containing protein, partial [Polyangiaceae bacterium]|nr:MXAN_5187 C-terminal domain-containing protein [Polyangiaceae bacterium]
VPIPAAPTPVAEAAPVVAIPAPAVGIPAVPVFQERREEDEATVVSQVPSEILGQLAANSRLPFEDEAAEWKRIYEEFVRLKKDCGEPVDGLSFDKFKNTLRKNRDQLLLRHGCKSVKFSVYVKEGKAALKANPVRE